MRAAALRHAWRFGLNNVHQLGDRRIGQAGFDSVQLETSEALYNSELGWTAAFTASELVVLPSPVYMYVHSECMRLSAMAVTASHRWRYLQANYSWIS